MPLVFGAGCYFSLAGRSTYVFKLQMIANTSSFKQCVKNNTLLVNNGGHIEWLECIKKEHLKRKRKSK